MLQVEYVPIQSIKPYERNARKHQDYDVDAIAASIQEFGFDDPIGIWGDEIVEGHGRLLAAKKLGMTEVPVIRLDHLTDEQRRAYALAHNKTAELSSWDLELQGLELADITDIDMSLFGFSQPVDENDVDVSENPYTKAVNIPQYEPQGQDASLDDLTDLRKYAELTNKIDNSGLAEDQKAFLKLAAARHIVFDYRKIAEYYAKADEKMQDMMEDSALVIIDVDDAIAKGYAVLKNSIEEIAFEGLDDD